MSQAVHLERQLAAQHRNLKLTTDLRDRQAPWRWTWLYGTPQYRQDATLDDVAMPRFAQNLGKLKNHLTWSTEFRPRNSNKRSIPDSESQWQNEENARIMILSKKCKYTC